MMQSQTFEIDKGLCNENLKMSTLWKKESLRSEWLKTILEMHKIISSSDVFVRKQTTSHFSYPLFHWWAKMALLPCILKIG